MASTLTAPADYIIAPFTDDHVVVAKVRGCEDVEFDGDWIIRDDSGEIVYRDLDGAVDLCGELTDNNRSDLVEYVVRQRDVAREDGAR